MPLIGVIDLQIRMPLRKLMQLGGAQLLDEKHYVLTQQQMVDLHDSLHREIGERIGHEARIDSFVWHAEFEYGGKRDE